MNQWRAGIRLRTTDEECEDEWLRPWVRYLLCSPDELLRTDRPATKSDDMKRYWQALVPSLPSVLKESFPDCCVEPTYSPDWNGHYPVRIVQTGDVTGDGVPEAVVYLGQGGASTDYITIMRIERGAAAVMLFKEASGRVGPKMLLQGGGAMHGDSTRMVPDEQAVYWMSTSNDAHGVADKCTVNAYRWNAQQQIFVWNKLLREQIAKAHCPKKGTPTGE